MVGKTSHSEDSDEEEDMISSTSVALTGDAHLSPAMAVAEAESGSDGCFKSLEAHIASEESEDSSIIPTAVEETVVCEPAFVLGDRGNPYYAAELNSMVEDQITAEVAYVTGDRGNPYYAEELANAASYFGEEGASTEQMYYTGDAEEAYNDNDSDNERTDYFRSLEAHISEEETRCGHQNVESGTTDVIVPEVVNYTGDAGNPYYAEELNRTGERSKSFVETHESNLVTAYSYVKGREEPLDVTDVEEPIVASAAYPTGDRGNPYYAAVLGLKPLDPSLEQWVEDHQLAESGCNVEEKPAEGTCVGPSALSGNLLVFQQNAASQCICQSLPPLLKNFCFPSLCTYPPATICLAFSCFVFPQPTHVCYCFF